jgi:hypothetical protein
VSAIRECHHIAIDGASAGTKSIADRDTIVEGHEEGVGIPVRWQMRSAMCMMR